MVIKEVKILKERRHSTLVRAGQASPLISGAVAAGQAATSQVRTAKIM